MQFYFLGSVEAGSSEGMGPVVDTVPIDDSGFQHGLWLVVAWFSLVCHARNYVVLLASCGVLCSSLLRSVYTRTAWACYITTARACRRIIRRHGGGMKKPPLRATPLRRTTWACPRTMSKPTCGSTLPLRTEVRREPSLVIVCCCMVRLIMLQRVSWLNYLMRFPSELSWVQIPSPAPIQDVKRHT